jgi:hypothetical protein
VATGPWDPMTAAWIGYGRLRASDADRERVVDALKTAFVRGLLTRDELSRRTGQALASRTYAELALVTAGLVAAAPPKAGPARARRRINKKALACAAGAVILLPAAVAAFLTFYGGFLILFLLVFTGTVVSTKPVVPRQPGPLPSAGHRLRA